MKKPIPFFILCLFLLVISAPSLAWEARVVAVADGDTITIEPPQGGDRVKVRLHGIDCPETKQPYGQTAKGFVSNTVLFKTVDVQSTPQGKDRYGRIVAVIEIPGVGILQELLLEAGLAWVYPQFCKDCGAWEAMEAEARRQRKGLWAGEKPIEPWEWRKKR
jgi:endonuclease YncB( thermonuclease family)